MLTFYLWNARFSIKTRRFIDALQESSVIDKILTDEFYYGKKMEELHSLSDHDVGIGIGELIFDRLEGGDAERYLTELSASFSYSKIKKGNVDESDEDYAIFNFLSELMDCWTLSQEEVANRIEGNSEAKKFYPDCGKCAYLLGEVWEIESIKCTGDRKYLLLQYEEITKANRRPERNYQGFVEESYKYDKKSFSELVGDDTKIRIEQESIHRSWPVTFNVSRLLSDRNECTLLPVMNLNESVMNKIKKISEPMNEEELAIVGVAHSSAIKFKITKKPQKGGNIRQSTELGKKRELLETSGYFPTGFSNMDEGWEFIQLEPQHRIPLSARHTPNADVTFLFFLDLTEDKKQKLMDLLQCNRQDKPISSVYISRLGIITIQYNIEHSDEKGLLVKYGKNTDSWQDSRTEIMRVHKHSDKELYEKLEKLHPGKEIIALLPYDSKKDKDLIDFFANKKF